MHMCNLVLAASTVMAYSPVLGGAGGTSFVWDDVIVEEDVTHVQNPSALTGLYKLLWDTRGMIEIHYWPLTYISF